MILLGVCLLSKQVSKDTIDINRESNSYHLKRLEGLILKYS